ncbi:MAG: NAD(P)H-binding protein [Dehalococcoidia bacterium]|nr:NAD(P)H-binding protein [Dehalococcoidia bacterium]
MDDHTEAVPARHVMVLGATGYVGGRLVPELLRNGHRVRVMTRDATTLDGVEWSEQVEVTEDLRHGLEDAVLRQPREDRPHDLVRRRLLEVRQRRPHLGPASRVVCLEAPEEDLGALDDVAVAGEDAHDAQRADRCDRAQERRQ